MPRARLLSPFLRTQPVKQFRPSQLCVSKGSAQLVLQLQLSLRPEQFERSRSVLSPYQKMLLEDVGGPDGYGSALIAWKGQQEFFRSGTPGAVGTPLTLDLALTFVEQVYVLVRTSRKISIYRGYETAGLDAPYGRDHPSYWRNLLTQRRPGRPDGLWWTPSRPSMEIDNLKLAGMHRAEHRNNAAIKLEWNRLDYYLESELPIGSLVYVGRAAPQQESAAYGGKRLGGGGFQFRLIQSPESLPWVKRYRAQ